MMQKYLVITKFDKAVALALIVPDDLAGSLFYTNRSVFSPSLKSRIVITLPRPLKNQKILEKFLYYATNEFGGIKILIQDFF